MKKIVPCARCRAGYLKRHFTNISPHTGFILFPQALVTSLLQLCSSKRPTRQKTRSHYQTTMGWKSVVILAGLKNTLLLQSCHMALLAERKAVVWDLIWEVRCLNHFGDSSHYPDFRCCRGWRAIWSSNQICNYFVHNREAKESFYYPWSNIMLGWLRNVSLACVASVSARVSRESWDEGKKKGMTGNNFRAITRLETLATQAMFLCLSVS